MKFDPIELAREIEVAYATDFIGDRNVLFTNILSRYGDLTAPLREKLSSLIKMRGPYIQALPIPKWSSMSWIQFARSVRSIYAPDGIDRQVIDLFAKTIKELYVFQEKAIKSILDDKNTLVVAGTGRGKTESWLIPIFHFILTAKRGKVPTHPPNSVKALLVYPTKALTQDQLKRLIKYLFELNKDLRESERITVGVYDGDTPSLSDTGHMAYLVNAFRYFRCPLFDSEKALCRSCEADNNNCSLVVLKGEKNIPQLFVPMPECRERIPLDFIHLTRDDIRDAKVDVLLTNPDIINFRLININADQERDAFIKEPKFVVLDEIHTLSGLFGSFVSLIMKRFMLVRKNLRDEESDDLRIIAASATISNKDEIFGKIASLNEDFALIEEEHERIKKELPSQIPPFFLESQLTRDSIIEAARKNLQNGTMNEPSRSLFKALNLLAGPPKDIESDKDLEDYLSERIFESITTALDERPQLDIIRALYSELLDQARTPSELLEHLMHYYPNVNKDSIQRLIQNFFTIGELSGILENRIHLFGWPLDGYYACINCGRIYENPQSECDTCHHHFISRITTCKICDEEAIESWFCSSCLKLYSFISNVEGRYAVFDVPKCNCTGQETECIRVVWKPYFQCGKCGKITKKSFMERCEKCGSKMLFDETGTHVVCTNPACAESQSPKPAKRCPNCNSNLELLTKESLQCPNCGKKLDAGTETTCECGATMHPVLYLPWVCDNENCAEVINAERPPAVCKCGSRKFYLAGLFDLTHAYYCKDCKDYFAIQSCGKPHHILEPQALDLREYRLIDRNFRIRKATESRRAAPCYHKRARYTRTRYLPLVRSPENVAVTSAQHALRKIIDHSTLTDMPANLRRAKILSFADSHGDMERLNRDFQEPEQEWFIDQLIVSVVERGETNLSELYENVKKEFDQRQNLYVRTCVDLSKRLAAGYQQRSRDKDKLIKEEVDKRIFGGYFYGRFETDRLISSGIMDLWFDLTGGIKLDEDETIFLNALYTYRSMDVGKLVNVLSPKLQGSFDKILRQLEAKELVIEENARLRISPKRLLCSLVSKDHPISWDPLTDTYCPTLREQLGEDFSSYVKFAQKYTDRADIFKSSFSKTAFRVGYSSPVIMLSEAYKGTTEKTFRRELEYHFKNGIYPNFLSSGPAMELGIDIGDLDILCLFGTPPNINSYLQRIGRAGRATKKSLVFSVSKRNPIDFYYYRNPLELIQSKPQPVPLNEHNPEVLKISLAWALLDFIATRFWIPWREDRRPDGIRITDGEEVVKKEPSATKPDKILHFTAVYSRKNNELDFGNRLFVLDKLLKNNRIEAKAWLESLLNYSFCPRCGRHYPSVYVGNCQSAGCSDTAVVRAQDRFSLLVEEVLDSFDKHFISIGTSFLKDLRAQRKKLRDQEIEFEDQLDETTDEDEKQRLNLLMDSVIEGQYQLRKLQQEIEEMPYSEFHKKTKEKKYAFDIRSVEEEVDIIYFKEEQNTDRFAPVAEGRGMQMALKEAHPYAVTTVGRQKRVACRVFFDEWSRDEIKQVFPDQLICSRCFKTYSDLGTSRCTCGGDLKILETHTPRRIEVYPSNYPLRDNIETGKGKLHPLDIHSSADAGNTVKSTMPHLEEKVIEFLPSLCWDIKDNQGKKIGIMEYGEISLATLVDSYVGVYEHGFVDRIPKYFELCAVEDCNSVVSQHGSHVCCRNYNHDPNQKKYVRLASIFKTYGIRLSTTEKDEVIAHTLAHGLRVGLQNIAGVHIRNIGEVVESEYAYVYDSEPGGSGVTTLLTTVEDGDYKNFKHAMDLFYRHLSACKCDDGCPNCIYQYGCAKRNDSRGLSRKRTDQWMVNGVNIVEATTAES
jgi:ATP-dependent helicase YprA (DUF1998 family)